MRFLLFASPFFLGLTGILYSAVRTHTINSSTASVVDEADEPALFI
jgi:hypothetical protein